MGLLYYLLSLVCGTDDVTRGNERKNVPATFVSFTLARSYHRALLLFAIKHTATLPTSERRAPQRSEGVLRSRYEGYLFETVRAAASRRSPTAPEMGDRARRKRKRR